MIKRTFFILLAFVWQVMCGIALSQPAQPGANTKQHLAEVDTSMWKYLAASDRSQWTITKADSETAIRIHFLNGRKVYAEVEKLNQQIQSKKITLTQVLDDQIRLMEQVQQNFEAGLRLNPFEIYLRNWIAGIYNYLEQLYAAKNMDQPRLQILMNSLCLEKDLKKRSILYSKIAEIYLSHQEWAQARKFFQLSNDMLFEGNEADIDSSRLFRNLYFRGQAELKLYEGEAARQSIIYASMIAPDTKTYQDLMSLLEYINWDDANIRASEQFMNARRLAADKKYAEAEAAYFELSTMVQTERAHQETQYRLAMLQFNNLNKKEDAIDRLWRVVQKCPIDPATGAAADSTGRNYWNAYCRMGLSLANSYLSTNKKLAFTYFYQTSLVESPVRGSAFLSLALLSRNIPENCLSFCDRAAQYIHQLTPNEQKLLYNIYYDANRRLGHFEEALVWFEKYQEL